MAFNRTAFVIFMCIASLAVSLSNAVNHQEWGDYSQYDVKVFDQTEWHPPRQGGGIREAKVNFPTLVGFSKYGCGRQVH